MANNRALAAALGTIIITYVRRRRQSGQIVGALGLEIFEAPIQVLPLPQAGCLLGSPKITSLATLVK